MTLLELFERFPDEESATQWIEQTRWPDGDRYCPKCGSDATREVKSRKPMPYWCSDCRSYFSVKTGTTMQSSKLPLRKWVIALFLMMDGSKGISSYRMAKAEGVTQKTTWMMMHKTREGLIPSNNTELSSIVEVDEAWIGGKRKNKHAKHRRALKRTLADKYMVVGAIERRPKGTQDPYKVSRVVARQLPAMTSETLVSFVEQFVEAGSSVFTDENESYSPIRAEYHHDSVCYSKRQYVSGDVTTHSIESFWAYLKRTWAGTYLW